MSDRTSLFALVFAGLFGAFGIAGAALAAHGGDSRLVAIAAGMALVHAPALLALATLPPERLRLAALAAALLVLGTLLFSGDLAARHFFGDRLFVNAAPTGGLVLILGWLTVSIGAAAAAIARRRR